MSLRRASLLAVLPLASLLACAAGTGSSASDSADLTNAPALTALKGREYARCWFDVVGADAQLSCTSTARGNDPLGATLTVAGAGMAGSFGTLGRALDIETGGTVVVGSLPRSNFPVVLTMQATLSSDAVKEVGLEKDAIVQRTETIASPEQMSASQPKALGQPYDLWPVVFLDSRSAGSSYAVNAAEYTRSIAPYENFFNEKTMTLQPSFSTLAQVGPRWFVAPDSGGIAAHLSGVPEATASVTIPGPGYYMLTSSEFRAATAEESGASGITPPATSTDTDAATPPPSTPATPADDPSCGGNGQLACAASVAKRCDDGTSYDTYDRKCVACGAAGQTYCTKAADNYTPQAGRCNDGTAYDSYDRKCIPCGAAGQTYCTKAADNYTPEAGRCNDGTVYDASDRKCSPCGAAGQRSCSENADNYTPQGNRCNESLTYDSYNRKCK